MPVILAFERQKEHESEAVLDNSRKFGPKNDGKFTTIRDLGTNKTGACKVGSEKRQTKIRRNQ